MSLRIRYGKSSRCTANPVLIATIVYSIAKTVKLDEMFVPITKEHLVTSLVMPNMSECGASSTERPFLLVLSFPTISHSVSNPTHGKGNQLPLLAESVAPLANGVCHQSTERLVTAQPVGTILLPITQEVFVNSTGVTYL
jgi:hypothetical protein